MPNIIMLAGAPQAGTWQEADLTVKEFLPAFTRCINDGRGDGYSVGSLFETAAPTISPGPVWRCVPLKDAHLPTGWSQQDWLQAPASPRHALGSNANLEISFLTSSDGSSGSQDNLELSRYLEKSFALHEEAQASQLAPVSETPVLHKHCTPATSFATDATTSHTSFSSEVSISPFNSPTVDCSPTPARSRTPLTLPNLTDLAKLPSASILESLDPQTVTVDLVAGVISISAPRTVTIRRTGRYIELVEVLVGDETKAGFCVTFWLPERPGDGVMRRPRPDLRNALLMTRPGQVVCMRNVALTRFRGVVHGQSLGPRRPWASTTSISRVEDIVRPARLAGRAARSVVLDKIERVRGWTRDFVRAPNAVPVDSRSDDSTRKRTRLAEPRGTELPPDDSQ